jgi:hypothetical protein
MVIEAQPLLNSLLKDDILDNGYVCQSQPLEGFRLTTGRSFKYPSTWNRPKMMENHLGNTIALSGTRENRTTAT